MYSIAASTKETREQGLVVWTLRCPYRCVIGRAAQNRAGELVDLRFVVKRTRVRDRRVAHLHEGAPSQVGVSRLSRSYARVEDAQREAAPWEATGDWACVILPVADGDDPTDPREDERP